jgi:RluA family pseudouridine synthase
MSSVPKIEVLYQDEALVIVNKPAGLPVHETSDPLRAHVQGLLEKQLNKKLVLHHRLDLETTGVLVFGHDRPDVNKAMTDIFRDRDIEKIYWAVVDGRWIESWTEVVTYIKKLPGGKWGNVPKGKSGAFAKSLFKVLASNGERSWLEVKLETGRTHQIRLHCLEKQHTILGDRTYGRADKRGYPMALHARSLQFPHPLSGENLRVEAPAPAYWDEYFLQGLKKT